MNIDGVEYVTVEEAANILKVKQSRVRQLIMYGKVESIKPGRDNYISLESLNAYAQAINERGRPKKVQSKPSTDD